MAPDSQQEEVEDLFDREAVMKFINDAGLLSYNVRALRINDYLKSLYRMAHLLSMSKLHREAIREVQDEIVQIIRDYVEDLKAAGKYDDLVQQVKQFKLATQIFDAFGETVDNYCFQASMRSMPRGKQQKSAFFWTSISRLWSRYTRH